MGAIKGKGAGPEPTPVVKPSKALDEALRAYEQAMKDGNLDLALDELRKARGLAPADDRVKKASADLATRLSQRSDLSTSEGKLEAALADMRAARDLDPENSQVKSSTTRWSQFFADRANRLMDAQKLGEAESQVKAALDLDPENVTAKKTGKRVAQAYAIRAANFLNEGKEAEARASLDSALKLDSQNELATMLHHSVVDDPVKELGTKSFAYTVKTGDTLSRISEQFLKEQYRFYLLARYNGIAVPRSLKVGQSIKVPGTKPPPQPIESKSRIAEPRPQPIPTTPVGPDASGNAASAYEDCKREWKSGDKGRAYSLCREANRLDPKNAQIQKDTERLHDELAQSLDRKAREAYRRQDLEGCISLWDKYLELVPGNESAKIERDRCERLKREIEGVGAK